MNRTPFDKMSIYLVSRFRTLCRHPDFQRKADLDHVEHIYNSIKETLNQQREPKLTGCLVAVHVPGDDIYLADGNHRLMAYSRILDDLEYDLPIYVQEITATDRGEAEEIFNRLNNSLPIAQMPSGIKRSSLYEVANHFYDKYGKVFRNTPSGTVKRPNVSRTSFETAINEALAADVPDLISKIGQYIVDLNHRSPHYFKRKSDTLEKVKEMLVKADNLQCRLGMIDLPDALVQHLKGTPDPSPPVTIKFQRKSLPKALRIKVWDTYCGNDKRISKCPFCNDVIKMEDFHCAHDISHVDGGAATIDNLYPCCATCNLSMGTATFTEFLKHWR